jgi:hypothetical protein
VGDGVLLAFFLAGKSACGWAAPRDDAVGFAD